MEFEIKIHFTGLYFYLNNWLKQINRSHIFHDSEWNTTYTSSVCDFLGQKLYKKKIQKYKS